MVTFNGEHRLRNMSLTSQMFPEIVNFSQLNSTSLHASWITDTLRYSVCERQQNPLHNDLSSRAFTLSTAHFAFHSCSTDI